nr:MAG TPA: hypothetical protein [Crassvirales sp.]
MQKHFLILKQIGLQNKKKNGSMRTLILLMLYRKILIMEGEDSALMNLEL